MRRQDRELKTREEILAVLERCMVARIGLYDGEKPYIIPMNFAWELKGETLCLYFHGAVQGRKMDIIAQNPVCCFEADGEMSVFPGENACNWSCAFESVMGEGTIAIVSDREQKRRALDMLMARYGFDGKPSYPDAALERTAVLKLTADCFTGKAR